VDLDDFTKLEGCNFIGSILDFGGAKIGFPQTKWYRWSLSNKQASHVSAEFSKSLQTYRGFNSRR